MIIYLIFCILVGILSFILFGALTKKVDGVVYNNLDKLGIITNIVLTIIFIIASPVYIFLGLISSPNYDGFLGIIGWIICILNCSTALLCGLGLGLSVSWRKKGKSKKSFIIQFLGIISIIFTVVSYCIFAGNLLQTLN